MKSAATPVAKGTPVLLIEDTSSLQILYRAILMRAGHPVSIAGTAAEGLALFLRDKPRVVLLDLMLPDRDGIELLREFLDRVSGTRVIVITANGTINKAVEAMRAGAHEFLVKPFDERRLLSAVTNAAAASPRRVVVAPRAEDTADEGFIGSSRIMAGLQAKIASVAGSMATVFITGESGTGKELAALAVHRQSPRALGPFIALNCGAIPQDLLESEVFGHVKGSFTGAVADKIGAAAAADGGTLFLDEVCEMLPALQTKLLRFLQTSTVQPVGATRPRKVNVRIVCATNRDPAEEVRRGNFREDLYYRLYVVPIHMPPLRDRGEDVIEIAETALLRFAAEEGGHFNGLSEQVKTMFRALPWPGNVRQLLNVMRNVAVLYEGDQVQLEMLPEDLGAQAGPALRYDVEQPAQTPSLDDLAGLSMAAIERKVIEAVLARHAGSVPRASRELELSPSTLYRKIEGWKD